MKLELGIAFSWGREIYRIIINFEKLSDIDKEECKSWGESI